MKAYVIDQGELKQYIFIAIIALVLSFAFGYIVGDGQDDDAQGMPEKTIDTAATDSSSPLPINKDANVTADKAGDKTAQKDLKKAKSEKKKETKKKPPQKPKTAVKKTSSKISDSKPAKAVKKKPSVKKKIVEKEKKSAPIKPKTKEPAVTAVSADKKSIEKSTSPRTEPVDAKEQGQVDNKRLYSIQAGMFASRKNAENFIEKLAVEKFEAYVSDFVSTSGAVKYNVRVGRFEERNKAREKLKEYQKYFSTPAYVVISQ